MHRATVRIFLIAILSLSLLQGCVSDSSLDLPTSNHGWDEQTSYGEVRAARKLVEDGRYSAAIPQLVSTLSQYPESEASVDARYFLGVSYFEIAVYGDADEMLRTYLALAPDGEYAKDSQMYLQKVRREYRSQYPTEEETAARLEALRATVAEAPDDVANLAELAGLLWRDGSYKEAASLYGKILALVPDFVDDERFKRRIEVSPAGEFVLLTPTEIQRRQIQNQPLAILNEASFRAGRDRRTQKARSYIVTGQILNRHDSILHGVRVNVTIYGFGNLVYDTSTVNIDQLRPGEKRAFSVGFSNFENIENVDRYEIIGTFTAIHK